MAGDVRKSQVMKHLYPLSRCLYFCGFKWKDGMIGFFSLVGVCLGEARLEPERLLVGRHKMPSER
jgi:hypothetical protein